MEIRLKSLFSVEGLKVEKLSRPFVYHKLTLINGLEEIQQSIIQHFAERNAWDFFGQSSVFQMGSAPFFYTGVNASPEIIETIYPVVSKIIFTDVEIFLDSLWFIKDNACCSLFGYSIISEKNFFRIINNYRLVSNCVGGFELVEFSNDELERAVEIDKKLSPMIRIGMDNESVLEKVVASNFTEGIENHRNYNEGGRIFRAYYFLKAARNSYFLVMKLSLYMNMYECLFTTDASEIVHKMSERVACYYTEDKIQRLEVFKLIKSAYTIRSRYFHGKDLGKDKILKSVPVVLKQIDDLTRVIFTKVVMEDEEMFSAKDMEPFFEKLMFS